MEFLIESVTDEIVWNIMGDKKIEGKENHAEELKKMKEEKAAELVLDQILSQRKEGAANGTTKKCKMTKNMHFRTFTCFLEQKVQK